MSDRIVMKRIIRCRCGSDLYRYSDHKTWIASRYLRVLPFRHYNFLCGPKKFRMALFITRRIIRIMRFGYTIGRIAIVAKQILTTIDTGGFFSTWPTTARIVILPSELNTVGYHCRHNLIYHHMPFVPILSCMKKWTVDTDFTAPVVEYNCFRNLSEIPRIFIHTNRMLREEMRM